MNLRRLFVWTWTKRIWSEFQRNVNEEITKLSLAVKRTNPNEKNSKQIKQATKYRKKQCWKNDGGRTDYGMIAVLLAYCGKGYYGMQVDKNGLKTIEGALLASFLKTGVIRENQVEFPHLRKFMRASRTDKGVSAVGQVVSLNVKPPDNFSEKLNEHLPPDIRVFGYKRVTGNFNCKKRCDARTYSYMLPTYAFAPVEIVTNERYRVTEDVLANVNSILANFLGTHKFHNFTKYQTIEDASSRRSIMKFECGQPFLKDGLEFVVITVKGNSFMLHQIRKMIGLMIAVVRGMAPVDTIIRAWDPHKLDLPMVPGLGLVLEQVHYDWYNGLFANDEIPEPLLWENYSEEINKFKEAYICRHIINTEKNEKSMLKWLGTLTYYTYDLMRPEQRTMLCLMGLTLIRKEKLLAMQEQDDLNVDEEIQVNIAPQISSQLT